MTTNDKTVNKLQQLETLYRQGYRSEIVDHSIDKIIALERAAAQREEIDLRKRLQGFEALYHLSSADFYVRFCAGEMGDAMDMVEWSIFYDMWQAVQARLAILEAA